MPSANTIIVAGVYIGGCTLPEWSNKNYGRTSRLYLSEYFLDVVKPLIPIVKYLRKKGFRAIECESSTKENSILPLKLAAIRAGIGWQGKNSLLITKKYGSFLALGGIITDAQFNFKNQQETDYCQKCNLCMTVCPLRAIESPYQLNSDKCLCKLLQLDEFSEITQSVMENRIGDCEICQDICPWNKKHISKPLDTILTRNFKKKIKVWKERFYLGNLEMLTKENYKELFGELNTTIPFEIFKRNVSKAIGNRDKV